MLTGIWFWFEMCSSLMACLGCWIYGCYWLYGWFNWNCWLLLFPWSKLPSLSRRAWKLWPIAIWLLAYLLKASCYWSGALWTSTSIAYIFLYLFYGNGLPSVWLYGSSYAFWGNLVTMFKFKVEVELSPWLWVDPSIYFNLLLRKVLSGEILERVDFES